MRNILIIVIAMVMLSGLSRADFGIGFAGGVGVKPGESVEKSFSVQNVIEPTADLAIEASVEEGKDYVSLIGEKRFEAKAGEIVSVPVRISVPEDKNAGDVFPAKIFFRTISGGAEEEGMIGFSMSIGKSFDIVVLDKDGKRTEVVEKVVEEIEEGGERKSLLDRIIEWISELFNAKKLQ